MRKYLSGELVDMVMRPGGIAFMKQNSQTVVAFLPWEKAFTAARAHQDTATVAQPEVLEFPRIRFAEDDGA